MESWLEALKAFWKEQGLFDQTVPPDSEDVSRFELKYSITLPLEIRHYFQFVNGMTLRPETGEDDHGFRFLPLSQVTCVGEFSGAMGWHIDDHRLSPKGSFVFVDYFQWSCAYAFEAGADANAPIYLLGYPQPEKVATSLEQFIELYLAGSPLLYKQ